MRIYHISQNFTSDWDDTDRLMDDLMHYGWGAANQLGDDNPVHKGWDVAFRIAKVCTKEKMDIAIRELRDAVQKVLKELWRLGRVSDPVVRKYADDLKEVLSRG